jgi:IMP cyclohydrolase
VAVVTNGSQTDPVAEKIAMGMPVRDALALSMLAMDFEKDDYSTPRICAVADRRDGSGWLGIVRKDGLDVRRMPLEPGKFFYVATYEENLVSAELTGAFTAGSAAEACQFMLNGGIFAERTNPVTAVAAMAAGDGFELATKDMPQA